MNAAVDYTQAAGFHHVDVPMYNVIANNRVQMHTHNLGLAKRFAESLNVHCIVESTTFELIAEYNA